MSVDSHPALLVSDPDAYVIEGPRRLIVLYGFPAAARAVVQRAAASPDCAVLLEGLTGTLDEASAVLMVGAEAGPTLTLWRGITSSRDLYLADRGSGRMPIVADHFRSAVAAIPTAARMLDPDGYADHLLLATTPGTRTLLTNVSRAGHGERISWRSGVLTRAIFDRLAAAPSDAPPPLGSIGDALETAMRNADVISGAANQLSGGVDSSLIQSFLAPGALTVHGAIDSPEFAMEIRYAADAAALFRTRPQSFVMKEGDYFDAVIGLTRAMGQPLKMPQTAVYSGVADADAPRLITGQFADCLFGLKPMRMYVRANRQAWWLKPMAALGLDAVVPGARGARLRQRYERLRQLALDVGDPHAVAGRASLFSNLPLVTRILGAAQIDARIASHTAYVGARFRSEETDPAVLWRHIEFTHIADYFCDDATSRWRQMMHTRGKSVVSPYLTRSVVNAALAFPRRLRYAQGERMKHLLKDLLRARVPTFDSDAAKIGGDVPFQRYFRSGPLKEAFARYAMPDGVDAETAAATQAQPDMLTWNLLSFAIWRDEVLKDRTLAPPPGTRAFALPRGVP